MENIKEGDFDMLSIRQLAAKSKISYHRLYNAINKRNGTVLNPDEMTTLANTIQKETSNALRSLGFRIDLVRIKTSKIS
jgi:hypothetical protein